MRLRLTRSFIDRVFRFSVRKKVAGSVTTSCHLCSLVFNTVSGGEKIIDGTFQRLVESRFSSVIREPICENKGWNP